MPSDRYSIEALKESFVRGDLSRRDFLRFTTLLGLPAVAAYSFADQIGGIGAVKPANAAQPRGGRLRIAMSVEDVSDPHRYWKPESANITGSVHQYLTRVGRDGITRPLLAEGWEASDDLTSWTFSLRDVTWHNGRPFTAEDVVWNLRRVLDPDLLSPMLGFFAQYLMQMGEFGPEIWDSNAIEILDHKTVRLNLMRPQVAIPEHLAHFSMAILDPDEGGEFGRGSNGTGPYRLVEYQERNRAILEALDGPFDRGHSVQEVHFVDFGEETYGSVGALLSHRIEGIHDLDQSRLGLLLKNPEDITIYSITTANTAVARMQVDYPPFDDQRVRLAMRLAIDTKECTRIVQGRYGAWGEHHHVAPIFPDYVELPYMERDLERAKRLLAEAGYPHGLQIEIACRREPVWELQAVKAMVNQWRVAGISVDIRIMSSSEFRDVWNKVPFGFTPWSARPTSHMVHLTAYASGSPWNDSHYSNPELDRILFELESTLDPLERKAHMERLEILMQQEGPIVQPLWRPIFTAFRSDVRGAGAHPLSLIFVDELSIVS